MSHIRRRYIVIAVIIIIVCGLLWVMRLFNVPIEHEIDITMRGIQTRNGDVEYVEEKNISIRGVQRQYRLGSRNDSFEGRIEIEGYDFTFDESLTVRLCFGDSGRFDEYQIKQSFLSYKGFRSRGLLGIIGVSEHMGMIFMTPRFCEFLIIVHEQSWNYYNPIFISFPADNREQAVDIANRLASSVAWE